MDTNARLRIATRIHFALLRHLGDSVDVQDILHRANESREVLWVCDASGDDELIALAAQFRRASRPAAPAAEAPVAAPVAAQPPERKERKRASAPPSPDSSWGRDTSGFGVSHPPDLRDAKAAEPSDRKRDREWFRPSTWLRTR